MTVTEALAYIAALQAHPGMIADSRRVREAAAVLAEAVNLFLEERKLRNMINDNAEMTSRLRRD